MEMPVLYYWGPCPTCKLVTARADELGIALDKRDIEQVLPYEELLKLGGDGNKIPYLYYQGELVQGVEACKQLLDKIAS